ncbi:MAG: VTT domain-containing protein [Candidatus Pacebacteria bacterium]|nr:VTT domain-containing protein [Candidatus Paceibacterota bacterium]
MFGAEFIVNIIEAAGYLGVFAIIFVETGLPVGFFLPGDSLLFAAGVLASQGYLNVWAAALIIFIAAVLGDSTGYLLGLKTGPKLFSREDSFFFHKRHLTEAHDFYQKYGSLTIIAARFMPVIRTFAPIVAGIGKMEYKKFLLFNVVGGLLWTILFVFAGYFLTAIFPGIENYLSVIVILIVFISFIPPAYQFFKERRKAGQNPR